MGAEEGLRHRLVGGHAEKAAKKKAQRSTGCFFPEWKEARHQMLDAERKWEHKAQNVGRHFGTCLREDWSSELPCFGREEDVVRKNRATHEENLLSGWFTSSDKEERLRRQKDEAEEVRKVSE